MAKEFRECNRAPGWMSHYLISIEWEGRILSKLLAEVAFYKGKDKKKKSKEK